VNEYSSHFKGEHGQFPFRLLGRFRFANQHSVISFGSTNY
jgi:hypothetical protein